MPPSDPVDLDTFRAVDIGAAVFTEGEPLPEARWPAMRLRAAPACGG